MEPAFLGRVTLKKDIYIPIELCYTTLVLRRGQAYGHSDQGLADGKNYILGGNQDDFKGKES